MTKVTRLRDYPNSNFFERIDRETKLLSTSFGNKKERRGRVITPRKGEPQQYESRVGKAPSVAARAQRVLRRSWVPVTRCLVVNYSLVPLGPPLTWSVSQLYTYVYNAPTIACASILPASPLSSLACTLSLISIWSSCEFGVVTIRKLIDPDSTISLRYLWKFIVYL